MVLNDVNQLSAAILLLVLVWLCGLIAYHDAIYLRIPNLLTLLLAVAGLFWAVAITGRDPPGVISGGVAGLVVLGGIRWAYAVVRKRPGLGLGDVKLAGAACIWIGILELPALLLVACLAACVHVCILYLRKQSTIDLSTKLPFGAHMVMSLCYVVLSGGAYHQSLT